ncbi:hypothetical protein EW145_g7934 [Phellinidium pouzarii]|uniref:F-box domain-containing protein n=1 Tax=Phellinidium pouzarii TaxID=167371 RepID=A0A4S4KCB2_9AGAM|nr:hypothetical protein EW145_g7934 [Phellinidium pouzarii]
MSLISISSTLGAARMLSDIDDDVILQICALLNVKDILSLRLTSKRLASLTRIRTIWHTALTHHILQKDLPLPWIPGVFSPDSEAYSSQHTFRHASALDLERITRAALYAKNKWQRGKSERERERHVKVGAGRLFALWFLDVRSVADRERAVPQDDEGRYILSSGHNASKLVIHIWDLDIPNADDIGAMTVGRWMERGRIIGLAVDEGNGMRGAFSEGFKDVRGALIAVSAKCFFDAPDVDISFFLRILSFMPSRSPSGLFVLKSFELLGPVNVRALHGRLLALQVRSEGVGQGYGHGKLKVVDWVQSSEINSGTIEQAGVDDVGQSEVSVELAPSVHGIDCSVLRVLFVYDWILVFRESALEVYFLPSSTLSSSASGGQRILYPTTTHKWRWQVNSLAVTERVSWAHERASAKCTTCNGRGYVITGGDASAITSAEKGERFVCVCRYRPISIVVRFDSLYPWPFNLMHHYVLHVRTYADIFPGDFSNLQRQSPYAAPPVLAHTISSTIRLFGRSVITIGRFGTVVWTDSETASEDVNDDPGPPFLYYGERTAGCRLPISVPPRASTAVPASVPHVVSVSRLEPAAAENMTTTTAAGLQPDDVGAEPALEPTPATTLFGMREQDGWHAVAVCERVGRIVLGDADGMLNIWDHFDLSPVGRLRGA